MKRLSARYNLSNLLLGSNEEIFTALSQSRNLNELMKLTKLSEATVFRSLEILDRK